MGSKLNFNPAQLKEILNAHENTLMQFFNTAIERLEKKVDNLKTENAALKKEIVDLKCSFILIQLTKSFLNLTQRCHKSTLLMMKISKL